MKNKFIKIFAITACCICLFIFAQYFITSIIATPADIYGPSAPAYWDGVKTSIEKKVGYELSEDEMLQIKSGLNQIDEHNYTVSYITDEGESIDLKGKFIFCNFRWSEI